ncbi:MAG: hypothetical protein QXP58_05415 [Thermoprotei archaeon]
MRTPVISLLFHSHIPYKSIRPLVAHAVKLGYRTIWVNDTEWGRPFELLDRLRGDFNDVRLGVAAISVCKWFGVEPKKLLLGLPPDVCVAFGVGDLRQCLAAKIGLNRLLERLVLLAGTAKDMGFKTLLAAQGPKMLRLASRFDGVVFGFLKPAPVSYARGIVGDVEFLTTAPSLVYTEGYTEYAYRKLISSAKYVYNGSSEAVRRFFPNLEDYYVMGRLDEVKILMDELGELGVKSAILAYPQTMNKALITQAYPLSL